MTRSMSAPITVSRRGSTPQDPDADSTVVWVSGEHDLATKVSLVVAIARAAQRDDADLLVDLSEVTFMDASTIGALVGSRNRLRTRFQSLQLRAPSPPASRVLELCGLAHLIQASAAGTVHPAGMLHHTGTAAALSSWVEIAPSTSQLVLDKPVPPTQREPAPFRATAAASRSKTSATTERDRGGP
jgi:anti-sigma B factor antagonist